MEQVISHNFLKKGSNLILVYNLFVGLFGLLASYLYKSNYNYENILILFKPNKSIGTSMRDQLNSW
jgi:hypothetical protein